MATLSISTLSRRSFGRLSCHGRVSHITLFLLQWLLVGFNHGHACIRRLHHVVILNGSEVEKRFLLNGFGRVLRLLAIVSLAGVGLLHFPFLKVSGFWLFNYCGGFVLRS